MNRAFAVALVAVVTSLGCLQTEAPQPQADPLRTEAEDEAPGPGGDDDQLPLARAERQQCIPLTCADLAASCGSAPDGCGGVVQCGSCAEGEECGLSERNSCANAESPRTCLLRACADECGLMSDGCAGVVDCGPCR